MYKKYLSFALVAAGLLVLAACGLENSQPIVSTGETTQAATETQTVPTTEDPGYGVDTWPADVEDPSLAESTRPVATEPAETGNTNTELNQGGEMTFEQYLCLSAEEQLAYFYTFPSHEAYINWYNAAKAEYDNKEVIEVTGPVDLGGMG